MGKDYYEILELPRKATTKEINESFKRLAADLNEDRSTNSESEKRYRDVVEAFEVLSDPIKRSEYDRFEEEMRNKPIVSGPAAMMDLPFPPPFGGQTPFSGAFNDFMMGQAEAAAKDGAYVTKTYIYDDGSGPTIITNKNIQDAPIEKELLVTLEEISKGCTKYVEFTKVVINDEGILTNEKKKLPVQIKPGTKAGFTVIFPNEGDQSTDKNRFPADIVVVVKEKPHEKFSRSGSDLRYTAKISLKEALLGNPVEVPTLTGEKVSLTFTGTIKPGTQRTLTGYGLPGAQGVGKGNLIVVFEVVFPDTLTKAAKDAIKTALP